MPKITLLRPEKWKRQVKDITIFIDDIEVGNIDKLKNLDFDVSPNKHQVLIKNKWGAESNPLEVDLSNNEDKIILMSSSKYVFLAFLTVACIITYIYSFIRGSFSIEPNTINDTFVLIFMYVLLFFLFFRKNYLKLKEVGISKEWLKAVMKS